MKFFACFFLAVVTNAHKDPSKFDALKAKSNPRFVRGATTLRFDTKLTLGDTECGSGNEMDYRGTVSTTEDGAACENWAGDWGDSADFWPDAGLEENFCRNPDGDERAWCFTEGWTDWKYCDVPKCEDNAVSPTGANSVGPTYSPTGAPTYSPSMDNAAEGADRIIAAN